MKEKYNKLKFYAAYSLYNLLTIAGLPLIIIYYLLFKTKKNPLYKKRIHERLGLINSSTKCDVVMHAVSVGEVNAIKPLILELNNRFNLAVTTFTPTGSENLINFLKQNNIEKRVKHYYLPFDFIPSLLFFFIKLRPKLLVIGETEIWPNCIYVCRFLNIKTLIINGRLSPKSLLGYKKFSWIFDQTIKDINQVLTQNDYETNNFKSVSPNSNIKTSGNLKYDMAIPTDDINNLKQFKNNKLKDYKVIIAVSTHAGEEEKVLEIFEKCQHLDKNYKLIIVPRHPNRFNDVLNLIVNKKLSVANKSNLESLEEVDFSNYEVLLGDTMGEIFKYLSISDIAIMGGTFENIGGHNYLEPLSVGIPVISGTKYFNFQAMVEELLKLNLITICEDNNGIVNIIHDKLNSKGSCCNNAAYNKFMLKHQGATKRSLELILKLTNHY